MSEVPHTRRVKVTNRGIDDLHEKINDKQYDLLKGQTMTMARREAIEFAGHYPGEIDGRRIEKTLVFEPIPDSGSSMREKANQFICPACTATFTKESAFKAHLLIHKELRVDDEEDVPGPQKIYVCPECDKEFAMKAHWANHMKSHKETVSA